MSDCFIFQSIMEYNGGCVLAMVGKDSVAIATDLRFGVQGMTIATNYEVKYHLFLSFVMGPG